MKSLALGTYNPQLSESFLTLKNYKTPLRAIPRRQGFGYYGTIAITRDGREIQCHLCGKLFTNLSAHVWQSHKVKVRDYRSQFQLSPDTALISEVFRQELKQKTLDWVKTLSPEQKEEMKQKTQAARAEYFEKRMPLPQPKASLEQKNERGSCPDQLLDKVLEVAKKLGHTPSLAEFIDQTGGQRYKHLIFATFGSWKRALELLGMTPQPGGKRKKPINRIEGRFEYTEDELLEHLKIFVEIHNRIPTHTDCKRGLIPGEYSYKRLGGLVKARELAGIEVPPIKLGYKGGYGTVIPSYQTN